MKKPRVLVIIIAVLATFCTRREDTSGPDLWRYVEPRLTGVDRWSECTALPLEGDRVVRMARCEGAPAPATGRCPAIADHDAALQAVTSQHHCIDAAIERLEDLATRDSEVLSDLAAAYYVRAQAQDQPEDLLTALTAAERAVRRNPRSANALFNRALIQEAVGLESEAIQSWDAFIALEPRGKWTDEGRRRRATLFANADPMSRWARSREALKIALRGRNEKRIAALIEPFPYSAVRYFEDELLAEWANEPSEEKLAGLELYAKVLSARLKGDRFALDIVAAIRRASPEQREWLRRGHRVFREARLKERLFGWTLAEKAHGTASEFLQRGGSPSYLLSDVVKATARMFDAADPRRFETPLDDIQRHAESRRYLHFVAFIRSTRALFLKEQGLSVDAMKEYDRAVALANYLNDPTTGFVASTRKAGLYTDVGHGQFAWREVMRARAHLASVSDVKHRHALFGEMSRAAELLSAPATALSYQNHALRMLQDEFRLSSPVDVVAVQRLQRQIAIARQRRAEIYLALNELDHAMADLNEAKRLMPEADQTFSRSVQVKILESDGVALAERRPTGAVNAFTRALALLPEGEMRSTRVSLLVQRAEAYARMEAPEKAEEDLVAALAELRAEQSLMLQKRKRGEGEDVWSPYFSRFNDAYGHLVRHLVDTKRSKDAFLYAEQARAFEPIDLILQRKDVPQAFRALTASDTLDLAKAQALIPPGTFVIQYFVLDDLTYAWVLSRDNLIPLKLTVRREQIERWSAELQRAGERKDPDRFRKLLTAPFSALIAAPLAEIRKTPGLERLVFVPDGAIHGLPLAALRDPANGRYLFQEAPVSIAGSTTLHLYSLLRDAALPRSGRSLLLIGDPAFDENLPFARGLGRLKGAEREVDAIHGDYTPTPEIKKGGDATVPAFLALAPKSNIIHIAAHAIANSRNPSRSMILFAPSEHHSGAFEAQELLTKLTLHSTRLVVLSACSSAGGHPVGAEGLAPLVRPLMTAGVPAVLGSLWDVRDATVEPLLVSFHRHYRDGSDAALALQAAQLELLKSDKPDHRSVLTWAPFQVIGHASSPFAAPVDGGTNLGIHSANLLHRTDDVHPQ